MNSIRPESEIEKSLDEYEDYPYLYDCFEEKVLLEKNETITQCH